MIRTHMWKKRGVVFIASDLGVWLCLKADPRKLKHEKVQNPHPRKLLPSKISRYTVCPYGIERLKANMNIRQASLVAFRYSISKYYPCGYEVIEGIDVSMTLNLAKNQPR